MAKSRFFYVAFPTTEGTYTLKERLEKMFARYKATRNAEIWELPFNDDIDPKIRVKDLFMLTSFSLIQLRTLILQAGLGDIFEEIFNVIGDGMVRMEKAITMCNMITPLKERIEGAVGPPVIGVRVTEENLSAIDPDSLRVIVEAYAQTKGLPVPEGMNHEEVMTWVKDNIFTRKDAN